MRANALIAIAPLLLGSSEYRDLILPQSSTHHDIHVKGVRYLEVEVEGSGNTNIDCWVYDKKTRVVSADTRPEDRCILSWVASDGEYSLRLKNTGNEENVYRVHIRETVLL